MRDAILIEDLELTAHLGVPEAERAEPQRLTVSLRFEPIRDFRQLADDLAQTVDYAAVAAAMQAVAAARPRRLLETLAEDLAAAVLARFAIEAVELTVYKFILPDTRAVAVTLRRER